MNSQQYLSQEAADSQDIRVQMGEQVHMELHHPQHGKYAQQRYYPMIKVNNHFSTRNERINERGPPELVGRDSVGFEPQRFHPTIKANNCFIAEDGRKYERPLEHPEDGPALCGQQNFQPAINVNNHFIMEDARNYERGISHQCHYAATTSLQVPNHKKDKSKYLLRNTQWEELNRNLTWWEDHRVKVQLTYIKHKNMIRGHSRQIQRNPDIHERGRSGENLINRESAEINHIQQDAVNLNSNFGISQETLGRDVTNNSLRQEARQNRSIQTPIEDGNQGVTAREEAINTNNQPHIQSIHREYSNDERIISSDRQLFAPQEENT